MRVIKFSDVVHILEQHMESREAASIVLDLLDYMFIIEDTEN